MSHHDQPTADPRKVGQLHRLDTLSDQELGTVVQAGKQVHLPEGWALISENTPADAAYLIVEGEVSVRKNKQEVARLGPGDLIGEMAIVGHKLRSASVVSLTPLELVHFTAEAVQQLDAEVPAFARAMEETTRDRLGDPEQAG